MALLADPVCSNCGHDMSEHEQDPIRKITKCSRCLEIKNGKPFGFCGCEIEVVDLNKKPTKDSLIRFIGRNTGPCVDLREIKVPHIPAPEPVKLTQESMEAASEEKFHGHPKFYEAALAEIKLHSNKNHDYAKGGNPLGNFQRVAHLMEIYHGINWETTYGNAIVQMLKQFDAVLWGLAHSTEMKVEGYQERFRDISIYSKLIPIMIEEEKELKTKC